MVSVCNYSKIAPPKIIITINFTITAVRRTTDKVRMTPCLSIQLAIKPGIILPITAKDVPSIDRKRIFLDTNPKKNPKINTKFITDFAGNIGTPAMIFYTVTTTGITLNIFINYFF